MNTIKTLVVVATLLGVGYGAHVILNKPVPNHQFAANENGFPTLPGFEKPQLALPGSTPATPEISLPPLNSGTVSLPASAPQQTSINTPNSLPTTPPSLVNSGASSALPPLRSEGALPPLQNQTLPTSPATMQSLTDQATNRLAEARGTIEQVANQAASSIQGAADRIATQGTGAMQQATDTMQQYVDQAQRQLASQTDQAVAAMDRLATNVETTQNRMADNLSSVSNAGLTTPVPPPMGVTQTTNLTPLTPPASGARMSTLFEQTWTDAQTKLSGGQLADALLMLSMAYPDPMLSAEQRNRLLPLLDQLAGTVIYSKDFQMEPHYTVSAGESLESIAAAHRIPPEFLMKTNQLTSPVVQVGQQLKIIRGPFRGELNTTTRELTLFAGRYYAGRFPIGIGRDFPMDSSDLEIISRNGPQPYLDVTTNTRIMAGDPRSPYGGVHLGMRSHTAPGLTNLAMHSTGAQVGASDARGCIVLSNDDAEDLKAIFVVGSRISVKR